MNERTVTPTPDTIRLQRAAGDPLSSAWISANAGSGKTYILTERVLRILLTGVRPEEILCLTYTKAAAAEMKDRVAKRLASWAVMDEAGLVKELEKVTGAPPEPRILERARSLFAHALETPGGLKINTIHAFCESVLQRFPLEAGVPVGFAVIEETEQADMIRKAIDQVLAEGLKGHPEVGEAVSTLFALMSDFQIDAAINAALARSRTLRDVLADPAAAQQNLARLLGVPETLTRADVEAEVLAGDFGQAEAEAVWAITPPDSEKNRFEDKLARIDWADPSPSDLFAAFLTQSGTVPKRGFPKADIVKADPDLADQIELEADRLEALLGQLRAADILALSNALLLVLAAVNARYQRAKALHNRLDFDDLITRLVALLDLRATRDWVRYKLDSGITHILVDESQDTNPDQWRVVTQLAEEFFYGEGAARQTRTIFAVGDEKQSIYSFQGAVPALFAETGIDMRRRAREVDAPFVRDAFRASFRTLENILNAVDKVSEDAEVAAGLLLELGNPRHETSRDDKGGTVTLWPPISPDDEEKRADEEWPTEPVVHQKTAPNRLAERIVEQIKGWIDKERELAFRERAVTADDVLILVQTRGPLFHALMAELKRQNIPTPGADRVSVTGHIVTDDLLALADVLNDPADDLQLAALLRSPLFGLSEDQIFALAHGRNRTSLWRRLEQSRDADANSAFARLSGWRNRLDFDRPYEFFARLLFAEGGLRQFRTRLGAEIDDVIAEFLDLALAHEQSDQPGLIGFVAEMRARDVAIKRELAEAGRGVRVMTVHGAKGLEAPIVILADACSSRIDTGPVYVEGGAKPLLAYVPNKPAHTEQSLSALRQPDEDRQRQESWRLLYVGMTRAEDELYVTGFLNKRSKIEGSWYDKIEKALEGECAEIELPGEEGVAALHYPEEVPEPKPIKPVPPAIAPAGDAHLDLSALPAPEIVEIVSPSHAGDHSVRISGALQTKVQQTLDEEIAATDPDLARRRGTALHVLLQHLAKVPPEIRARVADEALSVLLPKNPEAHAGLAGKALSILGGSQAGFLFGPESRAELPFIVPIRHGGRDKRMIGQIDRTIVSGEAIWLVDFKSDALPATSVDEVPPAYLTQLGLYRLAGKKLFAGKLIRAGLFWTETESLMELPQERLEAAIGGYTLR